jgi:hypothetical protein
VGLNFKTVLSLLWLAMKITVATGVVKSSMPVATMIGPAWHRSNVVTGALMASTHCYCNICMKINMACFPFTSLHKKRLLTESSLVDPPSTHNRVLVGTHAHTCTNGHALRVKGGPGGVVSC